MERIAIAGFSIHRTDVRALEMVCRPASAELTGYLRRLSDAAGASELVFLATCNRVEVIFAREEGELPGLGDLGPLGAALSRDEASADEVARLLTLRTGRDAIRHLFRIACSLDSLMLGEDQIIGQVRSAYGQAADVGLVGPLLGPLFHNALQIGKRVRSETDLARHPVSVVNLAVAALAKRPASMPHKIAVVGAGSIGGLIVRALHDAGMTPELVVNRSLPRAESVARTCGAEAMTLDALRNGGAQVDVLVSATSSADVVLGPDDLSQLARVAPAGAGLFAIDLAVPRDLPDVVGHDVEVICLDDLRALADENRALRAAAAADAEQLIEAKVVSYTRRFREDVAAPVVSDLREASEELLSRELDGLLSGRLAHLGDDDRRAVERWARKTFGRLMHLPVSAIKRMVAESTLAGGTSDGGETTTE